MQFITDGLEPFVDAPLPELLAAWARLAQALGEELSEDHRVRLDQLYGPWQSEHEYLIRGYPPSPTS